MDQRAYVNKASGQTRVTLDGIDYLVIIDPKLVIGQRIKQDFTLFVRHTDDLVWHLVNANFLVSERVKAHRFLRNLAIETRITLFGNPTLGNATPLPFDNYNYDFT